MRALSHWAKSSGEDRIPILPDLLTSPWEVSRNEFLLKADDNPHLSVFILCGDDVPLVPQGKVIGTTLWDAAPDAVRHELSDACAAALYRQESVCKDGAFESSPESEVRYRSIFLPVRSTGHNDPGYVFGALSSKRVDVPHLAAA